VIAEALWVANGSQGPKYTGRTLRARLRTIMTPWMNEGFFADAVVLVEGEDDRAVVLAMAQYMDRDLEADGVSVIPCMGKSNLDRPYLIFTRLGIPTFLLWDSDKEGKDADPARNRYLLRLLGQKEEDWPNQVHRHFACFEQEAGRCIREQIGPGLFDELLTEAQRSLGVAKEKDALKNPTVLETVIEQAAAKGRRSETLETIVENIAAMVREGNEQS
jgi:predicted ATP-dependent endonuclease of OLD family